jgi:predicted outer membrane protein
MTKAIVVALALLAACGKSGEEQAREENEREAAKAAKEAVNEPAPTPVAKEASKAKPAEPEPTTPAEIEHARNQAMIDGRDKDVLRYCALGKLDDKSNPQALLGCTLAACRIKDADTARGYAKPLPKALMDQAKKVCAANQVGL